MYFVYIEDGERESGSFRAEKQYIFFTPVFTLSGTGK